MEEAKPLLASTTMDAFRTTHGLPNTELEVDDESRPPLTYQHQHFLDQLEFRDYFKAHNAPASSTPTSQEQHRTRTPIYVTVTIIRISDIKTSDSSFTLRVRLHMLWEDDLRGKGLGDMIDKEMAISGNPFYFTSDSQIMDKIDKAGIVVPQIKFMNATAYADADHPMMRVYPRPNQEEKDMAYWNQMWDVTLRHNFELESFPFDHQTLLLEVNLSDSRTFDHFHLVVNTVQFRKSAIDLNEWTLHVPRIARMSPKHRCVNVELMVSRKPGYYVWNIVFILLSISCLIFTAFVGPWDTTSDRVSISLTLILATIAFKFTVNEAIPKLNYQTLLDKYMVNTQLGLCAITLAACMAQVLDNCKNHLGIDWLDMVDVNSFDRWMMEVSAITHSLVQAQWFCKAYASYREERGNFLNEKHFVGLNPETKKVESRQWLCFHFTRTFFLPEHKMEPEAFSRADWNA